MEKSELRARLKAARLQLPAEQRALASDKIVASLIKLLDWEQITTIHCFVPIAELHEVDTRPFFEFVWEHQPHVATFTSQRDGKLMRINPDFEYEPSGQNTFDAIIVPTLGFDGSSHRLGYGGGYYDRFLETQLQAQKIGVCFEQGRVDNIPVESHDIALDTIITEKS